VASVAAIVAAVRLRVSLLGFGHCAATVGMIAQILPIGRYRHVATAIGRVVDLVVAILLGSCVDDEMRHLSILLFGGQLSATSS